GGVAIHFERVDDMEESDSETRALSLIELMLNCPLEIDISVVRQLRNTAGPNKFAHTDLAKVINAQSKRQATLPESQTARCAASLGQTQATLEDVDDSQNVIRGGFDAAALGERVFEPYGMGGLGFGGGLIVGTVSAAALNFACHSLSAQSDNKSVNGIQKEM